MTDGDWETEFAKYRLSPEFRQLRPDMTVDEFKPIFWFEYGHRMLGRSLGLIFGLPAVYFVARGHVKRPLAPALGLLFVMGGSQGLIGWWMVKSGLEEVKVGSGTGYGGYDIPRVSPYRLATHLSSAFAIYSLIVWTGFTVLRETPYLASRAPAEIADAMRLGRLVRPLGGLVAVTAISGAYVAGMKAGHHFNTFPLMDGELVPEGYGSELRPYWRNFFEHIPTVQFDHRVLATTTLAATTAIWAYSRRLPALPRRVRFGIDATLGMACVQVSLGITTLLYVVPVWLGAAHQGGALTLFTILLWTLHGLRVPRGGPALKNARRLLANTQNGTKSTTPVAARVRTPIVQAKRLYITCTAETIQT
jgi:cytochrome c oxidase assembly protein subunit 15